MSHDDLETRTLQVFDDMRRLADEYDAAGQRRPWYDHRYDWLRGPDNWTRLERGVFASRYIRPDNSVLDLCCGDGFFSGHCFGQRARLVHGVDRDAAAIDHAARFYSLPNIKFFLLDVTLQDFPLEKYDVIVWFDGMAYFTPDNRQIVLNKIMRSMSDGGVVIGSTPLNYGSQRRSVLTGNEGSFYSEDQLHDLLVGFFQIVETWESAWGPSRTQLYFVCKK